MLRDATEEKQLEDIRRLYESSFPKSEKKPFEFMRKRQEEGPSICWPLRMRRGSSAGWRL